MLILVFFLTGLLMLIVQTSFLTVHPLWVASPDLYYILLAFLAYRFDLLRSLIILLPLSWIMDVFSGVIVGTYPAIFFLSFVMLKVLDAKIPVRESLYQIPMIGIGYLLVHRLVYTFLAFFFPESIAPWSWPEMFVKLFLLLLVAFPLFRVLEYMNKRLQKNFIPYRVLRVRSGNRFRPEEKE